MPDDLFDTMASEEPDREDEIGGESSVDVDKYESSAEREAVSPNDSDMIAALKRMFPTVTQKDINETIQLLMVARVFPDTYLDKKYLTVISIKRRHQEMGIMLIENIIDTALSIGFMGKARVEVVVMQGNARAAEETGGSGGIQ